MTTHIDKPASSSSSQGAYSTGTGQAASLIDCKFNELARKIFDELKHVHYSREFFQALDVILKEPLEPLKFQQQQHKVSLSRSSSRSKVVLGQRDLKREEEERKARDDDKKLMKRLLDTQKEQQEQLDSHQQLLIDSQFKSLPSTGLDNSGKLKSATGTNKQVITSTNNNNINNITNNKFFATTNKLSTSKTTSALYTAKPSDWVDLPSQNRKKSAIPQSTVTSSTGTNNELTSSKSNKLSANNHLPLTRSSTIAGSSNLAAKRLSELRPVGNPNKAEIILKSSQPSTVAAAANAAATALMTASEKLKQRRPTKASLNHEGRRFGSQDNENGTSDDEDTSSDDNSSSGDDVEIKFANLAARRACLNERFLANQQQQQPVATTMSTATSDNIKSKTTSEVQTSTTATKQSAASVTSSYLAPKKQTSTIQRSSTICATSTSNNNNNNNNNGKQMRPAKFIAKSNFKRINENGNADNNQGVDDDFDYVNHYSNGDNDPVRHSLQQDYYDSREPRSIGTVHVVHNGGQRSSNGSLMGGQMTMSHLYKPHMNYSTSALGNHHRLSDDDEIIIIPTTRSPTISPALFGGSRTGTPSDGTTHHHRVSHNLLDVDGRHSECDDLDGENDGDDDDVSNMDELSERFSISRTKSFWEKLTNSKVGPKSSGFEQQQQQQQPVITNQPALVAVHSSSSECSPNKSNFQRQQPHNESITSLASGGGELIGVHQASSGTKSRKPAGRQIMASTTTTTTSPSNHSVSQLTTSQPLDSSGGSGNSNYSYSSGSGDENNVFQLQKQQLQRQTQLANAKSSQQSLQLKQQPLHQRNSLNSSTKNTNNNKLHHNQQQQQQNQQQQKQTRTVNCPRTVAAISQQLQEMSRTNRFRQTR